MPKRTLKDFRKKNLSTIPIYPIIFGVYPVLALTAHNIAEMDVGLSNRALIASLVSAMILFGVLGLILRNWPRAALLSLIWLVLFYSYGHVYGLLKNQTILGVIVGRHRYLSAIWAGLSILALWIISKKRINSQSIILPLNIGSLLLVTFSVAQIAQFQLTYSIRSHRLAANTPRNTALTPHQPYPDIYYIVLDGYGRSDTLAELFQYDNSQFIRALEQRGFYVAHCSQSNYSSTLYTATSLLNFEYLDVLSPDLDNLLELSIINLVRGVLSGRGYTIVGFETGWPWTQWNDADIYLPLEERIQTVNSLEALFMETTPVRIFSDYETARYMEKVVVLHEVTSVLNNQLRHHAQNLNILQSLKGMADKIESPKFVFAHLTVAHHPYVFGPNGEFLPPASEQEERTRYLDGLTFLNAEMPRVIDSIVANSERPPIIIIQGDHGPFHYDELHQKLEILSAYYLPGHMDVLYPTLTPVNTFRIIFNAYFGDNYDLLEDKSWYSPGFVNNTIFIDIPNQCDE